MHRRQNKTIRHWIELSLLMGFRLLFWSIPFPFALRLADMMGFVFFNIIRIRRRVALDNLRVAFPDKSPPERRRIACRSYAGFMRTILEFMRFPLLDHGSILDLCRFEDPDRIGAVLESEEGGLLIAGHFGNWELLGGAVAQLGPAVSAVVQEQSNTMVDRMIDDHRRKVGMKTIRLGLGVREVIRALKRNECVALLIDQDAGRNGAFVDFFGIPTSVHKGPAILTLRTKVPVLIGFPIREARGRYRVKWKQLKFDHLKEATPEHILNITQYLTSLLEEAIREHPDHWFWMHRRWKSSPPEMLRKGGG